MVISDYQYPCFGIHSELLLYQVIKAIPNKYNHRVGTTTGITRFWSEVLDRKRPVLSFHELFTVLAKNQNNNKLGKLNKNSPRTQTLLCVHYYLFGCRGYKKKVKIFTEKIKKSKYPTLPLNLNLPLKNNN